MEEGIIFKSYFLNRQVHLIHAELLDEMLSKGYVVHPGDLGENITTRGLDLLSLPRGAKLHILDKVVVVVCFCCWFVLLVVVEDGGILDINHISGVQRWWR